MKYLKKYNERAEFTSQWTASKLEEMLHLQLEDNGQFELLEEIVPNQAYRRGEEPRSKSIYVKGLFDVVTGIEATSDSKIKANIEIIEGFNDNEEINKMVDEFVDWRNEKSNIDWDKLDEIEWIAYQNEEEHRCRDIENRVLEINNKIFERLGKKFDLLFTVLSCSQWESFYTTIESNNMKSNKLSFFVNIHVMEPPEEKKSIWKSAINYIKKFNEDIDWGSEGIENWTPQEFSDMINVELEDNKQFEIIEIHFSTEPYLLRPSEDVIGQEIQIIESFVDEDIFYDAEPLRFINKRVVRPRVPLVIDINKKIFEKLGRKYDFTISQISCKHITNTSYKITFNIYFT